MSSGGPKQKGGDNWKTTRHDKWWKLAREQGYRSRAAFKLIQINKKYDFLSKSKAVIDLCACPGGWLQVCQKYMPISSLIIGVDLKPIKGIRGIVSLTHDITTQACRTALKKETQGWNVDVVLHDGAPNLGGATYANDAFVQVDLVLKSLQLATEFLRKGGWFVTKIFRSQDYTSILWVLQNFFEKVEIFKPAASRSASAETFAVCQGFKAPKKSDPKWFDPNEVFKQVEEKKQKKNVMTMDLTKRTRERGGYEEGDYTQFKSRPVSSWLKLSKTEEAIEWLGENTAFTWHDADSQVWKSHSATSDEIRLLVQDLKVLSKGDFSQLLKWREKIKKHHSELLKEQKRKDSPDDYDDDEDVAAKKADAKTKEQSVDKEEDEETKVDQTIAALEKKKEKDKRKDKKKKREAQRKEQKRMQLNANNLTGADLQDSEGQDGFRLTTIPDKAALDAISEGRLPPSEVKKGGDEDEGDLAAALGTRGHDDFSEGSDADESTSARRRHGNVIDDDADDIADEEDESRVKQLEQDYDRAYREYKERQGIFERKTKEKLGLTAEGNLIGTQAAADEEERRKRDEKKTKTSTAPKRVHGIDSDTDSEADMDDDEDGSLTAASIKLGADQHNNDDDDDEDNVDNGLLVKFDEKAPSAASRASRWFDKPLFKDLDTDASSTTLKVNAVKRRADVRVEAGEDLHIGQMHSSDDEDDDAANGDDDNDDDNDDDVPAARGQRRKQPSSATDINEDDEHDDDIASNAVGNGAAGKGKKRRLDASSSTSGTSKGPTIQHGLDGPRRERKEGPAMVAVTPVTDEWQDEPASDDEVKGKGVNPKGSKPQRGATGRSHGGEDPEDTFEEVPIEEISSDDDAIAERLAIGTLMLRKKKRGDVTEAAYGRYSFGDEDDAPSWFAEDESFHNRAQLPVTKEQVDLFKQRMAAINARPARKVAEAKGRKKVRAVRRWEKLQQKAQTIAESGDSAGEKMRAIEKMVKKTKSDDKRKSERKYVVAQKSGVNNKQSVGKNVKKVLVDSRMKADKRATKANTRRTNKGTKKDNVKRATKQASNASKKREAGAASGKGGKGGGSRKSTNFQGGGSKGKKGGRGQSGKR